jgi:hypothetical protein
MSWQCMRQHLSNIEPKTFQRHLFLTAVHAGIFWSQICCPPSPRHLLAFVFHEQCAAIL